jgi:hypothetical protein
MRRRFIGWAIGIFALAGCVAPAMADSKLACVRCSGPEQTYRCRAMSEETVPPQAVNFFCMSQIARDHVHESCAVVRNASECNGQDVSYVYQDGVDGPDLAAGGQAAVAPGPATVSEMTKGTFDATAKAGKAVGDATVKAGQAVGNATAKAGQAVGDATKRTLKCLGSALNDC